MKYLVKALVCLFIIMGIFTGSGKPVYAGSGDFNHETLDGIVLVYMDIIFEDEYLGSRAGTGFFVGVDGEDPQFLITNHHVIELYLKSGGGKAQSKLYVAYEQKDYEEAYVVAYDEVKDLAILKIANPTTKRKPLHLKTTSKDFVGATAFAIGFPVIADQTITSVTLYGKNDASVTGGRINRIITESGTGIKLLQIDVNIRGGNSGGPLVNNAGDVLGINSSGSPIDNNLNYAISIDELIPLLKNNNIPYQMEKGTNWTQSVIILAGAAFALILLTVIILLMAKGRKKKTVSAAPAAITPAATPAAPVSAPLAAAISQPIEPSVPVRPNRQPVVHSMSTQHGGMSIPLSRQPITIGRDVSACRIIFKEGTGGVSSRHCQLYFDDANGVFILTDLKSTYGTFLSNGQKLTANVPYTLKTKDSFYLGESDNVLYVDME